MTLTNVIIMVVVGAIIVFLFTGIYKNGVSFTTSRTKSIIEQNFNFLLAEKATEEELQERPVPPELLEYAKNLGSQLLDSPSFTRDGAGTLRFIEPFHAGLQNPKDYQDYHITLEESNAYGPGIIVYIVDEKIDRYIEVYTAQDYDFVKNKQLCFLPSLDDSQEINSILAYYMWGPERQTGYTPREIITAGAVERIILYVDSDGVMKSVVGGKSQEIFKYPQERITTEINIPVYTYGETVCMLAIDDGNAVNIQRTAGNSQGTQIVGAGPLHELTMQMIQTQDIEFKGDIT